MELRVADRADVETGLLIGRPYVLISITDADLPPAEIPVDPMRKGELRLRFDDVELSDDPMMRGRPSVLMRPQDAEAIWRFVMQHITEIQTIVVHCEAGLSRSPAVAAALCDCLGLNSAGFFRSYFPNMFVYRMVADHMPRKGAALT